jgi:hypothetical protein
MVKNSIMLFFYWNACVEERDKFGANIIKIKDKVRL